MSATPPAEPFARIEDAQRFLEQRVYDHFRATGEWPRAMDFDLDYYEALDRLGGLEVVCREIGSERLLCGSPSSESDRVMLRLPALADCDGAEDDLANLVAAAGVAAERYHQARGTNAQLTVADLVEALKIDEAAARRAIALLHIDDRITGGGGGDHVRLIHPASRMRGRRSTTTSSAALIPRRAGSPPRSTLRAWPPSVNPSRVPRSASSLVTPPTTPPWRSTFATCSARELSNPSRCCRVAGGRHSHGIRLARRDRD